jgi:hypothetical protein
VRARPPVLLALVEQQQRWRPPSRLPTVTVTRTAAVTVTDAADSGWHGRARVTVTVTRPA